MQQLYVCVRVCWIEVCVCVGYKCAAKDVCVCGKHVCTKIDMIHAHVACTSRIPCQDLGL